MEKAFRSVYGRGLSSTLCPPLRRLPFVVVFVEHLFEGDEVDYLTFRATGRREGLYLMGICN